MANKINPDELLTITAAAERRGVTRQNMDFLVRNGKIPSVSIGGKVFVRIKDLDAYIPDAGGRPSKQTISSEQKRAGKKQQ
jgi:excisionase family DNA binding protein